MAISDRAKQVRQGVASGLAVFFLVLLLGSVAHAHGVAPEDLASLERGGNPAYMWLGAKHMLTGYDHLLFIFGVIFFLTRVRDVAKFITAFTLGHSITLTFGTLFGVTMNYHIIDAIIALTVCYKALENIDGFRRYFNVSTPSLTMAVFVFGLIHGLGLATRLQQVPLPEDGLIARILSFNLGVELGQIAALSVMVVLLAAWRRRDSFATFSTVANKGLIAAGLLLFLMQLHGYSHTAYPDDFGFSQDLHLHAHQDIDTERQRAGHTDSLN
jgi:hydrogenase/urease accessory protein HupE